MRLALTRLKSMLVQHLRGLTGVHTTDIIVGGVLTALMLAAGGWALRQLLLFSDNPHHTLSASIVWSAVALALPLATGHLLLRYHEAQHALAARWLGIPTEDIIILPGKVVTPRITRLRDWLIIRLAPLGICSAVLLLTGTPAFFLASRLWGKAIADLVLATWLLWAFANSTISTRDLAAVLREAAKRNRG